MQTFKTFFKESYELSKPHHHQTVCIYPFDGDVWCKENTEIFNSISVKIPQSHYYVTIAGDGEILINKRKLIEACGIPNEQIIECANPFEPYSIIKMYNGENDSVILLLDNIQINQINNASHFNKYLKAEKILPYTKCIYYVHIPTNTSNVTLQSLVMHYFELTSIADKQQYVEKLFGNINFAQIDKILNDIVSGK